MANHAEQETVDPYADLSEQLSQLERVRENPLKHSAEAFELTDRTCTCIDEGTPGDFRIAGAGILDPEGFEHVVVTLRDAGVTKVTSHDDCGAVALAAKKELGPDATQEQITTFGQEWAKRVADALGVPYEHIDDVQRPEGEHDAPMITVDLEGGFHPERVPDFPKSFGITGLHTAPEHVAEQVRVAVNIMLGDNGKFHDQFSAEQPINVVLVGGDEGSPERHDLVEAIHAAVQDLGPVVKIGHLEVA